MFKNVVFKKLLISCITLLYLISCFLPISVSIYCDDNDILSKDKAYVVNDFKLKIGTPSDRLDGADAIPYCYMLEDDIMISKEFKLHLTKLNCSFCWEKNNDTYDLNDNISEDNVFFTHPLEYDILRAGDTIPIKGTINVDRFKCFKIQYGKGMIPIKWFSTGITLENDGTSSIINGTIGYWNTSHITEPDLYTLKITVCYKGRSSSTFSGGKNTYYIKNIYLDPTLKKGWPRRLNWHQIMGDGYYWGGGSEAVVSDINNDGALEILVYMGGNPPNIYAFNPDGSFVHGFPIEVNDEDLAGGNLDVLSTGDIDNDGFQEIFINGEDRIYIFNHDGNFRRTLTLNHTGHFPTYVSCIASSSTVLSDLNNDGNIEIIRKFFREDYDTDHDIVFSADMITVFDSEGDLLEGWPKACYDCLAPDGERYSVGMFFGFGFTQAVGDFDNDSDLEIVVSISRNVYEDPTDRDTWHYEGRIFVFNLDGSILDGFPVDIEGYIFLSSPVIGDVDNDGYDDIVVSTYNRGLYILNRYGNILDGWPKLTSEKISATPALADFNNDGLLEIVISTEGEPYNTYIIDYQGEIIPGWPQHTSYDAFRSPVVGDVNGDGNPDVLTTAGNGIHPGHLGNGGVYAWNFDGSLIDGFPKVTEVDAQAAATVADIDGDGMLELIASSNFDTTREERKRRSSVYVWELNSECSEGTMDWPMYHHDPGHTGYYTPINKSNIHPITPILDGPATGNIGEDCTYSVIASDPDGNQVYYWFDWGDGTNSIWIGPFDSGKTIYVNHTWNAKGSYEVKVKAKDIDGAWSFWSDPLQISISKNKPVSLLMLFLERMFNHFPFTEQMLNYFN